MAHNVSYLFPLYLICFHNDKHLVYRELLTTTKMQHWHPSCFSPSYFPTLLQDQAFCFLYDLISSYSLLSSFPAAATLMTPLLFRTCPGPRPLHLPLSVHNTASLYLPVWLTFSHPSMFVYNHLAVRLFLVVLFKKLHPAQTPHFLFSLSFPPCHIFFHRAKPYSNIYLLANFVYFLLVECTPYEHHSFLKILPTAVFQIVQWYLEYNRYLINIYWTNEWMNYYHLKLQCYSEQSNQTSAYYCSMLNGMHLKLLGPLWDVW